MDPDEPESGYCPMTLPNADTAEIIAEYSALIGRCLFAFADLEGLILSALRRLTELPDPVARAVIGAPRIMDASDRIVRIAVARKLDDDDIARLIEWKKFIKYVAEVRNVLAHQMPDWRIGWLRYDNLMTSVNLENVKKRIYVVRTEELQAFIQFIKLVQRVPYPLNGGRRHPPNILSSMNEAFDYWKSRDLPPYVGS